MSTPSHSAPAPRESRILAAVRRWSALALAVGLLAHALPVGAQSVVVLDDPALGALSPPEAASPAALQPPPVIVEQPGRLGAPPAIVVLDQAVAAPTPTTGVRRAPDLSAPLPVAPTPVPPSPTPVPTVAPLPATLTPTPVPPPPTPTVSIAVGPTAVPIVVLPTEPPAPGGSEDPGASRAAPSEPAAPAGSTAPSSRNAAASSAPAPQRPAVAAIPFQPQPPPSRSYVSGLPPEPGAAGWLDEKLLWLGVPSRTQYDGTPYQSANCGPSALGMILEAYGLKMVTAEIRDFANYLQGTYGYDDGIALDHLADIGRRANLKPLGLYGERGYHRWSVDDVRAAVSRGYPVIALTVYRLLPWSGGYGGNINHYIVISGLLGDDFLYNDSAFGGPGGKGLVITAEELEAAWAYADIPRHAVAFGVGDQGHGLLGLDPSRYGRGPGDGRLLASNASIDPRPRAAAGGTFESPLFRLNPGAADGLVADAVGAGPARIAPPDPATVAREALLGAGPTSAAALLEAPLTGGTTTASFVPAAVLPPDTPPPAADEYADEPTSAESGAAGLLRILIVLGGVGGLYLLLLAQAALARLGRPRDPSAAG